MRHEPRRKMQKQATLNINDNYQYLIMARHLKLICFSFYVFFSGFLSSCNHGQIEIIYMDFLDGSGETYYGMDTLHKEPFKTMTLYFLVDQKSKLRKIDYKRLVRETRTKT